MISTDLAEAYQQPVEDVVAGLGSDAGRGLTTDEARRRLAQYGPNELQAEPPTPAWRKFLAQFQDVLIILLLIAAAISLVVWVYERHEPLPFEALVIFAIVLLNGILGFVQEERAERSVAALRAMAAAEAAVLRDGRLQVAVVYVPFLQSAFSTVPLRAGDWLTCALVASGVLWLREIAKAVRRAVARSR